MAGISTKTGAVTRPSKPGTNPLPPGKGSSNDGGQDGANKSKGKLKKSTPKKAESKAKKKVAGREREYIEGSMEVLPNCDYTVGQVYNIGGVGPIFEGSYYVQKVTHTISDSYKVTLNITQVNKTKVGTDTKVARRMFEKPPLPKAKDNPSSGIVTAPHYKDLGATALENGTTVKEIMKLNGLTNPNEVKPGQNLKVPKGAK